MLPSPRADAAVLITGASSGIGEELAREFARRGYPVVLVARRADRLRGLAESLGPSAHVLPVDLSNAQERAQLPQRVAQLGLAVDVLVNNAGLSTAGPVAESDPAAELNLVEVDVSAVVDLCSRFVPQMVARGRGVVLNLGSVGAFGPLPGQAAYGAAKAFVVSYTHALNEELRGTGVRAATLCPGPVKTGFGAAVGISDEDAEAAMPKVMWVDAATVARKAVDGLTAGKTVIVPGLANRIGAAANHLLPRGLLTRMVARSHPALKRGRKA
ncbi:oxidoreductase [Mycobacteroides sp. H001]|uniref:SDR family NAD(P)-dependent oxidoreductase n=1 Tax=Mycobacteroides TaxID=670516 RepID=UPI00071547CB|nr:MULTISPECIES: SDR family oxidoreductase [Mycobacteroides]KRQ28972.1 oxidoreductase [Mycobacteroides sp. H072]KRQ38566.1 oxidoreductase [Mycobacteroides sp. H002]KRQ49009.1 oxidoreductase [Mycobacteroides sp. H054]KRQ71543.1 oxidoreductase [Mycobacteroides sp. H001]OHU32559.1 oxidoreductase [Mycobacteroides chelonae]